MGTSLAPAPSPKLTYRMGGDTPADTTFPCVNLEGRTCIQDTDSGPLWTPSMGRLGKADTKTWCVLFFGYTEPITGKWQFP
eukprot:1140178-Pelagomonas_calceolata.AAC.2